MANPSENTDCLNYGYASISFMPIDSTLASISLNNPTGGFDIICDGSKITGLASGT